MATRTRRRPSATRKTPAATATAERLPQTSHQQQLPTNVLLALVGLAALGIGLRVALMTAVNPAFYGLSDSAFYLLAAADGIFGFAAQPDSMAWPAGYPFFLQAVHVISSTLTAPILIQHGLGVGSAFMLFATVRRVVSPRWALLPAGIVLLAGPIIMLEHAPLTEPLFAFLATAMLYCAVRALETQQARWSLLAGLAAASASCVRVAGLPLVALLVVWLIWVSRGTPKQRLISPLVALIAASLVFTVYLVEMKRETGFGGPFLTKSGNYGTPTRSESAGGELDRLTRGFAGLWSSDTRRSLTVGYGYNALMDFTDAKTGDTVRIVDAGANDPTDKLKSVRQIKQMYPTTELQVTDTLSTLRSYERHTRIEGVSFFALLLVACGGIALTRGRRLAVGLLFLAVTTVVVLVPIAYVYFDARYAIPAYGFLGAAAAIGGASLWDRIAQGRTAALPQT